MYLLRFHPTASGGRSSGAETARSTAPMIERRLSPDEELPRLVRALERPSHRGSKWYAVIGIYDIAKKGEDVGTAMPALSKALEDPELEIRRTVAAVLRGIAEIRWIWQAVPALAKALGDPDVGVRGDAIRALRIANEHEEDVTQAAPALRKALDEPDVQTRMYVQSVYGSVVRKIAAREGKDVIGVYAESLGDASPGIKRWAAIELRNAARKGQDVRSAIPALAKALEGTDPNVVSDVLRALSAVVEKGYNITVAMAALGGVVDSADWITVKIEAAEVIRSAAARGQNITAAMPALGRTLEYRWRYIKDEGLISVRRNAVSALRSAAGWGQDTAVVMGALRTALDDIDGEVRRDARSAYGNAVLRMAASKGQNIAVLYAAALEDGHTGVKYWATEELEKAVDPAYIRPRLARIEGWFARAPVEERARVKEWANSTFGNGEGLDIRVAMPGLARLAGQVLERDKYDIHRYIRDNATRALRKAAVKRQNMSPALDELTFAQAQD